MIYEIKHAGLTAKIDTVGAQLISLQNAEGTEYIWQRNPEIWSSCSPLLFPIIGNLKDGKTVIEGKTYEMPKHGPTRNIPFHLLKQEESSVTLGITDRDFPDGVYPYDFIFSVTYSLSKDSLSFLIEIKNPASAPISYCIGLHPAIRCPLFPGESFEDYIIRFPELQTTGYRTYDLKHLQFDKSVEHPFPGSGCEIPLTRNLFDIDAIWFDRPNAREASLINPSTGKGIRAEFPDFETVAFWTKPVKEAEYLCFEPWNGSAACSDEDGAFIHKNHLQTLPGGKSQTYRLILTLLS